MIITATDFQLRVNEYFTRLMQGEEIVIERYGKKFAVLVAYDEYQKLLGQSSSVATQTTNEPVGKVNITNGQADSKSEATLTSIEVTKLVKLLIANQA